MARAYALESHVAWIRDQGRRGRRPAELIGDLERRVGGSVSIEAVRGVMYGETYQDLPGAVDRHAELRSAAQQAAWREGRKKAPKRPHSKYPELHIRAVKELHDIGVRTRVIAAIMAIPNDYVREIVRGRVWADTPGAVGEEEVWDLPYEAMLLLLGAEAE